MVRGAHGRELKPHFSGTELRKRLSLPGKLVNEARRWLWSF